MTPLFPPWSNTLLRATLGAALAGGIGLPLFQLGLVRAPYTTYEFDPIDQPIQFDHRHHVRDEGISCLYCHSTARDAPGAGIPPTSVCMNCHSQVWNASAALAPVRRSYFTGAPLVWNRVHNLPDFVYFDHSAHVTHGVGCESCHGRVDRMGLVYSVAPLTMGWCLDCHRDPAPNLRPRSEITTMGFVPGPPEAQARLAVELGVAPPTHCTGCHR